MISASRSAALSICLITGLGCASRNLGPEPSHAPIVTAEDIESNPSESIEKILQAKVPGLLVTRLPNGGLALQIRGPSSFGSSSVPLYVIDDVPVDPGPGGQLPINPHDIASIRVLKDPADIGIYGMRGANGVILITTKKPGKR
jgi:TonB-dependent SusC/RagA subfamily outer membrane receptor